MVVNIGVFVGVGRVYAMQQALPHLKSDESSQRFLLQLMDALEAEKARFEAAGADLSNPAPLIGTCRSTNERTHTQ